MKPKNAQAMSELTPQQIAANSSSNWRVEPPFAMVPPEMTLDERLSKRNFRVLLILLRSANEAGQCWPTQLTIAYSLKMDRADVNKEIRDLIGLGWLEIAGTYKAKSGRAANVYQLKIPPELVLRAAALKKSRRGNDVDGGDDSE